MSDAVAFRKVGALSPFDEARRQIDIWEKEYPLTDRIGLVLDADELVVTVTGDDIKPSMAAGIFFAAAQAVIE